MDLIGVIPTGKVWGLILKDLILDVRNSFKEAGKDVSLDILTERPYPIPQLAFDKDLGKYRVEGFFLKGLDIKTEVERVHEISIDKVLILTDVDLCDPPNMNGFGYSDTVTKISAIVSIYRLQRGADKGVLRDRLVKESLHELGHTYGLDHCARSECPMSVSPSVLEIDQKLKRFCSRCTNLLLDSGYGEYWGV
jgi:archaemetzincin